MFIQKNYSFRGVIAFTGGHLIWITAWVSIVALLYETFHAEWMSIPWLPISVIGTAVAFYVGFKNNQAYERLWEARKIWGGIINSSRSWGSAVKSFVSNKFTDVKLKEDELFEIKKRLIYRHIAWVYTLRNQLLIPAPWEHINQNKMVARVAEKRIKKYGVGLVNDGQIEEIFKKFVPTNEEEKLINFKNTATQIIDTQSQDLYLLRENEIIEDFRHMELQKILNDFYDHQGKCERIKKFPLPRQYGGLSFIFTGIFIFLLPLGMVSEFHKLGDFGAWISIPFSVLICWVYITMELVGDYTENPFEGMGNDIPMLSLCRTIEIDLREMLGEKDLPPAIEPINGILM